MHALPEALLPPDHGHIGSALRLSLIHILFVTGGVVSGLGKGITAASLGRLLKARGYKVTMQKFDPYINIDPGTMNPVPVSYTHLFASPFSG